MVDRHAESRGDELSRRILALALAFGGAAVGMLTWLTFIAPMETRLWVADQASVALGSAPAASLGTTGTARAAETDAVE